jgi:hypothetical protein
MKPKPHHVVAPQSCILSDLPYIAQKLNFTTVVLLSHLMISCTTRALKPTSESLNCITLHTLPNRIKLFRNVVIVFELVSFSLVCSLLLLLLAGPGCHWRHCWLEVVRALSKASRILLLRDLVLSRRCH